MNEPDPVVELMAVMGVEVLARINADYEDSLLLIGRILGDRRDATGMAITAMDRHGLDATLTVPEGTRPARIEFAEPVEDAGRITRALFELVERARTLSGEEGMTAAEQQIAAMSSIRTFVTSVVAVTDVHPHLRQVTFGGGDLVTFEPLGPDTFLYLLLPPPGRTELGVDGTFSWEEHAKAAPEDQQVGAYYTLRRWRPEISELDILMVLHGDAGHASAWASVVEPGMRVALWGPRTSWEPPEGTTHYLLVADETGLPATAVILEQLPAGVTAHVLAEVESTDVRQELPDVPGATVEWFPRDGAEPGTSTVLPDAVRALPDLPATTYVWGGAESRIMTAIRKHVRVERGFPRESVSLVAYWRRAGDSVEGLPDASADDLED